MLNWTILGEVTYVIYSNLLNGSYDKILKNKRSLNFVKPKKYVN